MKSGLKFGQENPYEVIVCGAGHAGWNLKITGSGGRSGRIQYETISVLTNAA